MAIKTINIGSSQNKGDGDPLRDAFGKINDNFEYVDAKLTALEDGNIVTDVKGNVFAEDSTLLVDAINASIPYSVLSGTPTIPTTLSELSGDYTGSVFGDDSTLLVDGVNNLVTGKVTPTTFMPPMLSQAEIDALTPEVGMMIYNTTTGKFQGYAEDANNDSTIGWADLH